MSYPPYPPGHIPGLHVPGTNVPIPYALEQGRLAAEAAAWAKQIAAAEAATARRKLMARRWFTPEHTWAVLDGQTATVGLTDHATGQLHDILYVSLPAVGTMVAAGSPCGQVESVRAIWDLYAPVAGQVTVINGALDPEPRRVNKEPFGDGWLFRISVANAEAMVQSSLLSPHQYEELTRSDD